MLSRARIFAAVLFLSCSIADAAPATQRSKRPLDLETGWGKFVGRLSWKESDDALSVCTATLIGPKKILTAQHCMPMKNGSIDKRIEVTFYIGYRNGQIAKNGQLARLRNPVTGKTHFKEDRGSDWVLADLDVAPYEKETELTYPLLARLDDLSTAAVETAGYSEDFDDGEIASVADGKLHAVTPSEILYHDCDMYLGSSGGPIVGTLKNGKRAIVGVMTFHGLEPVELSLEDGKKIDLDTFKLGVTLKSALGALTPALPTPQAQAVRPTQPVAPPSTRFRGFRSR